MDEITRQFKRGNTSDLNKISKLGALDYSLFAYFTGFISCLKYLNQNKYYEDAGFENKNITNSKIINLFMEKYNVDPGSLSEKTLRRKLTNMINEIDSNFFGCK